MSRIKKKDIEGLEKQDPKKKESEEGKKQNLIYKRLHARQRRKSLFRERLEKAGIESKDKVITRVIAIVSILMNIFLTIFALNHFADKLADNYLFIIILLAVIWTLGLVMVVFLIWLMFYVMIDVVIFKRKQQLEEVLPDFLQLASSNIRAGMTVDQALWFAIRPRFGVLAKEIEEVAKRTYAGEPLENALQNLVNKYESTVLERSVNLMVEGIRAGGEVGELLNKISLNIQETNIMKKEMAASVTTYVIFIGFSTVFAAPFLFAMAFHLVQVIQLVFSKINIAPGAVTGMSIQISEGIININDFMIFAVVSLMITSLFSGIIISTNK